jgi:hypothetical protein
MASARSRKRDARAISTPESLESGGETSTVTTKRPDWQACSKPKVSRAGATFGRMTVGLEWVPSITRSHDERFQRR